MINAPQHPEPIGTILARTEQPKTAILGRYPYTYAFDYIRAHAAEFQMPGGLRTSHAEISDWYEKTYGDATTDDMAFQGVIDLADAYLRETNEHLAPEDRLATLAEIEEIRRNAKVKLANREHATTL